MAQSVVNFKILFSQKKMPVAVFFTCLLGEVLTYPLFTYLYRYDYFLANFIQYGVQIAFAVAMLLCIVWFLLIIKSWRVRVPSLLFLSALSFIFFAWFMMGVGLLPRRTEQVKDSPNGAYKAVVYTEGYLEVTPSLAIEGLDLTPRIVYVGNEHISKLEYTWLDNERLQVIENNDWSTHPSGKPFIIHIHKAIRFKYKNALGKYRKYIGKGER